MNGDGRTRIMFFVMSLLPGDNATTITVEAEDVLLRRYTLPVEYVGDAPSVLGLGVRQINVRLPDALAGLGEISLIVRVRGTTSNKARIRIE